MCHLVKLICSACFITLFFFSQSFADETVAKKIISHISEDIECNSNSRDKIFAVGDVNTKSYFCCVNGDGDLFEKAAYVINKDKIMIYSAFKDYYCVGFMKDYNFDKIYYGLIAKENIIFDNYIASLSKYIVK